VGSYPIGANGAAGSNYTLTWVGAHVSTAVSLSGGAANLTTSSGVFQLTDTAARRKGLIVPWIRSD